MCSLTRLGELGESYGDSRSSFGLHSSVELRPTVIRHGQMMPMGRGRTWAIFNLLGTLDAWTFGARDEGGKFDVLTLLASSGLCTASVRRQLSGATLVCVGVLGIGTATRCC